MSRQNKGRNNRHKNNDRKPRRRQFRGPKPMTVADCLAHDNLGGEAGRAFSRLKRQGEFDEVKPSALISSLTATGEARRRE